MPEAIVLAYSGGLDTSYCVPWLIDEYGAEVITVTADVGGLDAGELGAKSRAAGATRHVHVDARRTFFDEILRWLIAGNVLRGEFYPLCVGAERSLQAREVARVARELGVTAVAHGCTAAGNDQVRFEVALRTAAPDLKILAPIRDHAPSRDDEVAYLATKGVDVAASTGAYSINSGLWGVTIGGRETLDTAESIPEEAWARTRGAFDSPRAAERHVIAFERGVPCALDGAALDPVALIEELDALAAGFGIGRGIHLGETILGNKGRVAFEAPAASVLITSHRELEKLVLTARQQRTKDHLARIYGDLVHEGQFLEPSCRDIEALFESTQQRVTGTVTVLLRTGSLFVEGVASLHSLRAASTAVYGEAAGEWSPEDAKGFSRLIGLPGILHARAGTPAPGSSESAESAR
ncbi:MAG: argininosuccinate synthase [Planctomycetes bacterium]|nr:argininosuccinate synthase [Planctomycetota bacterium]